METVEAEADATHVPACIRKKDSAGRVRHVNHRHVQTGDGLVKHLDLVFGVLGILVGNREVRPQCGYMEVRRAMDSTDKVMNDSRGSTNPVHPSVGLDVDLE